MNINIEPLEMETYFDKNNDVYHCCLGYKVRKLEADFKEAIEALVEYHQIQETYLSVMDASFERWNKITPIIEKATGQNWEDMNV